jgi:hypothetical protein
MRQDGDVVQMHRPPLRALAGERMPGGEEGLSQPEMQVQHGGAALFAQAFRNALQCGGDGSASARQAASNSEEAS